MAALSWVTNLIYWFLEDWTYNIFEFFVYYVLLLTHIIMQKYFPQTDQLIYSKEKTLNLW